MLVPNDGQHNKDQGFPFLLLFSLVIVLLAFLSTRDVGVESSVAHFPASNAGTALKFMKECTLPETRGEPVTRPGCLVLLRDGQVFTVHQGKDTIIVARNDPIGWYKHIRNDELFREGGDFTRIIFPDDPDYLKFARAFITSLPVKE